MAGEYGPMDDVPPYEDLQQVIDIFKAVIPGVLWREEEECVDVRFQWPKLAPGTVIAKVSVAEALRQLRPDASPSSPVPGPAAPAASSSGAQSSVQQLPPLPPIIPPKPFPDTGTLPKSVERAHADDKMELAKMFGQARGKAPAQDSGASGGTGSGPPDLKTVVRESIEGDTVQRQAKEGEEEEEVDFGTDSGAEDHMVNDTEDHMVNDTVMSTDAQVRDLQKGP